jgi:hypothetical protein
VALSEVEDFSALLVELDEEGGGVVAQGAVMVQDAVRKLADRLGRVAMGSGLVAEERHKTFLAEIFAPGAVRIDHAVGDAKDPVAGLEGVMGDLGQAPTEAGGQGRRARQ